MSGRDANGRALGLTVDAVRAALTAHTLTVVPEILPRIERVDATVAGVSPGC